MPEDGGNFGWETAILVILFHKFLEIDALSEALRNCINLLLFLLSAKLFDSQNLVEVLHGSEFAEPGVYAFKGLKPDREDFCWLLVSCCAAEYVAPYSVKV